MDGPSCHYSDTCVTDYTDLILRANQDVLNGTYNVEAVASVKAEQKTSPRPTYAGDLASRSVLRAETAASELVAAGVPETATTYEGQRQACLH